MIQVRERMNLLVCALLSLFCGLLYGSGAESEQSVFTNVQQILDLGIEKARHTSGSASITGVVTYPLPDRTLAFIQDNTAGILVLYTNADVEAKSGDSVRIVGLIGAGLLSPIIRRANLQIIAPSSPPVPRKVSAAHLAAGESFGQWVELDGTVRDVARDAARLIAFVSSGGMRF